MVDPSVVPLCTFGAGGLPRPSLVRLSARVRPCAHMPTQLVATNHGRPQGEFNPSPLLLLCLNPPKMQTSTPTQIGVNLDDNWQCRLKNKHDGRVDCPLYHLSEQ